MEIFSATLKGDIFCSIQTKSNPFLMKKACVETCRNEAMKIYGSIVFFSVLYDSTAFLVFLTMDVRIAVLTVECSKQITHENP